MDVGAPVRDVNSAQHQDLKSSKHATLNGKIAPLGVSAVNAETKDESDQEVNDAMEDEVVEDAMQCNGGMNSGGYSEHSENQTQSAISTSTTDSGLANGLDYSSAVSSLLSAVKAHQSKHRAE